MPLHTQQRAYHQKGRPQPMLARTSSVEMPRAFTLGGVKRSYQTDFKVNGIRMLRNDKNFIRELETVEKEPNGNSRAVKQLSEVKNHGNAFKSKLNSPKEYHITGRQIRRNYPS